MLSKYEPFTKCSSRLPCEQIHQLTFPIDIQNTPKSGGSSARRPASLPHKHKRRNALPRG